MPERLQELRRDLLHRPARVHRSGQILGLVVLLQGGGLFTVGFGARPGGLLRIVVALLERPGIHHLRSGPVGTLLRSLGQSDAGELVYETNSQKTAHDRQDERNHQYQKRHQESVLETLTSSHPPCGVATNQEGQQQRDQ